MVLGKDAEIRCDQMAEAIFSKLGASGKSYQQANVLRKKTYYPNRVDLAYGESEIFYLFADKFQNRYNFVSYMKKT